MMFSSGRSQVFSLTVDLTQSDETQFLLDVPRNLPLCDGSEGVNTVQEQHFRAAKKFGDTLEVRRVAQVATHSEPNTRRFQGSRATRCTVFGDGVSQKYDEQTEPMGSPPMEALAKEAPASAW